MNGANCGNQNFRRNTDPARTLIRRDADLSRDGISRIAESSELYELLEQELTNPVSLEVVPEYRVVLARKVLEKMRLGMPVWTSCGTGIVCDGFGNRNELV